MKLTPKNFHSFYGKLLILSSCMLSAFTIYELRIPTTPVKPVIKFLAPPEEENLVYKINFQDAATQVPQGYFRDSGEPFGPKSAPDQGDGTLVYGWVDSASQNPTNLKNQTNNRNLLDNDKYDTFIAIRNTLTPSKGRWHIQLPNGKYQITVSVGDPSLEVASEIHRIKANNKTIINNFLSQGTQGSASRFLIKTDVVEVRNGLLILSDEGNPATNTKINYIEIYKIHQRPYVVGATITNQTDLRDKLNVSISTTEISFPQETQVSGLNNFTLNVGTIKIYEKLSELAVSLTSVNGTGGGDAITASAQLNFNTSYILEITENVKDINAQAMIPYKFEFTTQPKINNQEPIDIRFTKQVVFTSEAAVTSLTVGPDYKLYGCNFVGTILRWDINEDGTLSNLEEINSLQIAEGGPRLPIGLRFDPSSRADSLVLWVSHSTWGLENMPDWGGKISLLSAPQLQRVETYVTNLPRSAKDHLTNSIDFGPDGALYVLQGSNSAMGLPDNKWAFRPERLLTAAVLRLDVKAAQRGTLPLDAKTEEGGTYDGKGALTVFGSGIRNAYDLVWHSNGQLYIPANGSAAGGNAPGSYGDASVANAIRPGTQNDYLFRIVKGGYYGHPNPLRNEWIINGGNPTPVNDGPNEIPEYPVGTFPDSTYKGYSYNFGLNKSANGIIEYKGNAFKGDLKGSLLITRYSAGDDIIVLKLGGNSLDIIDDQTGIPGFTGFNDPLDLIEDPVRGNIYLTEFNQNASTHSIILLKPQDTFTPQQTSYTVDNNRILLSAINKTSSSPQWVTITNTGTLPLINLQVNIQGSDVSEFEIINPPPKLLPSKTKARFAIKLSPQTVGIKNAVIKIKCFNADSSQVVLKGLSIQGEGDEYEPSLQQIADFYELDITIGDDDPQTPIIHSKDFNKNLLGEEVNTQLFEKSGDKTVEIQVLSAFGSRNPNNNVVEVGWYENPSNLNNTLFNVSNTLTSYQMLVASTTGQLSFSAPDNSFGIFTSWPYFNNRKIFSEDIYNTFENALPNHVRVYPIKTKSDSYLIAFEEDTDFSYQDLVFLIHNVKPLIGQITSLYSEFGKIKIWPNPAHTVLQAQWPSGLKSQQVSFRILTAQGITLKEFISDKDTFCSFDVSAYAPGLYLIEADFKGEKYYQRWIKQ